jgi:hypothetical protein
MDDNVHALNPVPEQTDKKGSPVRNAIAAVFIGTSTLALADGRPDARFETAKVAAEDIRLFETEVRAMPNVQCVEHVAPVTICMSIQQRSNWQFTRAGHSAHPAVVRHISLSQPTNAADGSAVRSVISGHYAGDEASYREMKAEVEAVRAKLDAVMDRVLPRRTQPDLPPRTAPRLPQST